MILQIINDTANEVINQVVNTGIAIHENTGGGQIINGIDNSVTGSIVTLLLTAIIRYFERRKLIKKLKNND